MYRLISFRSAVLAVVLLAAGSTSAFAQATDAPATMPESRTPTTFDDPGLVQQYQATITPEDLAAYLFTFASDYFEGRETATRGQKLAATYLAGQYRKLGLEPRGTATPAHRFAPEAYFQPFEVYGQRLAHATLTIDTPNAPAVEISFSPEHYSDQAYFTFGSAEEAAGGVVFAGYGISDADLGYDDYAALAEQGIDYSGQWLMLLADEPLADAETSLLTPDGALSPWTTSRRSKLRMLLRGTRPQGVLIVGDRSPRQQQSLQMQAAQAAANLSGVGSLSLDPPEGGNTRGTFPPIYVISSDLANQILAPTGQTIEQVQQQIDETLEPQVFAIDGVTVNSTLTHETFSAETENVLAFLEGSDPDLKDEVVVLSSHYDHIGMTEGEGDTINNGADDDGSGTVSILEMAEAFMQAKQDGYGPRRSILFLNVSGEEKGLLGSEYYADQEPVLPLDKTVTNLNIDMIGRHDPTYPGTDSNYVYIIGSNLISQELHDINVQANAVTGTDLVLNERFNSKDDPNQFYARSDHWNFGKHSIPFIFFFTGTHDDYHGVDDEPEKIDYDRLARIARLIFATAWQVANQDIPPAVSGQGFN